MSELNGRRKLDYWFPTLVRYAGFGMVLYGGLIDQGQHPAIIPTGLGMILFKNVYGEGPPPPGKE